MKKCALLTSSRFIKQLKVTPSLEFDDPVIVYHLQKNKFELVSSGTKYKLAPNQEDNLNKLDK